MDPLTNIPQSPSGARWSFLFRRHAFRFKEFWVIIHSAKGNKAMIFCRIRVLEAAQRRLPMSTNESLSRNTERPRQGGSWKRINRIAENRVTLRNTRQRRFRGMHLSNGIQWKWGDGEGGSGCMERGCQQKRCFAKSFKQLAESQMADARFQGLSIRLTGKSHFSWRGKQNYLNVARVLLTRIDVGSGWHSSQPNHLQLCSVCPPGSRTFGLNESGARRI